VIRDENREDPKMRAVFEKSAMFHCVSPQKCRIRDR
jgi:hypothetical protein